MRGFISLALLPVLASAAPSFISDSFAPLYSSQYNAELPDSYIVVFKNHVTEASAAIHHSWVEQVHNEAETQRSELRKRSQNPIISEVFNGLKHTYNIAGNFTGYAGHFDEQTIEKVRRHPDVEYVERDSIVHTMDHSGAEIEKSAPWGLARISHREHLNFANFNKYFYASRAGEGVDVYVIDTGTYVEHDEFEGRGVWGKTIPMNDVDEDGNGHGTHCSATIAGKKYGVAKLANIIAVKVLSSNGSGSMSDVIKGVDWATKSHIENVRNKKRGFKGSAANMSLGGGKSRALDLAVNGAVTAGIHFAVAAGNDNADSCKYSPAAAELAITVGASTLDDSRAYFSNFGACNDIFAPGLNIKSAWIGSRQAVNVISGTSMASPHIAGLIAYYLSFQPEIDSDYSTSHMTPKKLKESIIAVATKNAMSGVPSDTANVLAWNGGGESNFSSIVEQGSYSAIPTFEDAPEDVPLTPFESIREVIQENVESVIAPIDIDVEEITSEVRMMAKTLSNFFGSESETPCEEMEALDF